MFLTDYSKSPPTTFTTMALCATVSSLAFDDAASVCTAVPAPCSHNDWDDVRQRKGVKVLRCRVCNLTWRWPRGAKRGDAGLERCIDFLNDRCSKQGSECPLLHVRRSKKSLEERVEAFGDEVLSRVPMPKKNGKRYSECTSSDNGLTDCVTQSITDSPAASPRSFLSQEFPSRGPSTYCASSACLDFDASLLTTCSMLDIPTVSEPRAVHSSIYNMSDDAMMYDATLLYNVPDVESVDGDSWSCADPLDMFLQAGLL